MRAAAIFGLGCSPKTLDAFQKDSNVAWHFGMPSSRDEADAILIFGGDGTIHRHLGQLVELGLPVLIVPAGSGNDFARALKLRGRSDSVAAWKQFSNGADNVQTIDLGTIAPALAPSASKSSSSDRRYFASVAGVGIDGEVAQRANKLPRWLRGHGGYLFVLIPTVLRFAPLPMKISTPENGSWRSRSQPTILAAFANTVAYGGGMKIAPHARFDDGLLDICIVGNVSRLKLFSVFPSVYAGRHLHIREVEYFQSPQARIESEYPLPVYADGEYVCQTPAEISVQRGALKVITP